MMRKSFESWMDSQLARVECKLDELVCANVPAGLGEVMRYGVLDGGKRLRPLLVLAAHEAVCLGDGAATHEAALRAYGGYCWITDTETVLARLAALGA